jgi:hypothetical protein
MRAAMRRALDTSDGELALSLSASLKGFLIEQWRPLEARDLLTYALRVATEQTPPKLRADALLARSHVRVRDGGDREDAETALGLYREIGDARGVARSLVALGFHESWGPDASSPPAAAPTRLGIVFESQASTSGSPASCRSACWRRRRSRKQIGAGRTRSAR